MGSSFVAYVDEAGDDGCTAKSSEWFVLSAVVTEKANDTTTLKALFGSVRLALKKSEDRPLHFLG